MKQQRNTIRQIGTLVRLRDQDVERRQQDLAAQQHTLQRYRTNLERLTALGAASSVPPGALPAPALMLNRGHYTEAVLALAASHRTDLALHEATMAVAQRALHTAWAGREALSLVQRQKEQALQVAEQRAEGRRHDDMAAAWWLRAHR